jgi:hypothetical protein
MVVATPVAVSAVPQFDVSGTTPASTAIAVSRSAFPAGSESVVIAQEGVWQDQIAGASLAGALCGSMLLSSPSTVTAPLAAELTRLGATRVFVLEHERLPRLASQVASALPDGAHVVSVRTSDVSRGARTISRVVAATRSVAPTSALVLNPGSWVGAVAAVSAASAGWPVLFADAARPGANANALAELGVSRAVVVGGASATLDAETTALRNVLGDVNVVRVQGPNRYAMASTVARTIAPSAGMGFSAPVIVPGARWQEAVLAGTLGARRGSVVLLGAPDGIGNDIAGDLFARRGSIASLAFVGSVSDLPKRQRAEAQQALRARAFSQSRAMRHVRTLASYGPRRAGGRAERKAAQYVSARLREYGYTVTSQSFPIPGNKRSMNIIAQKVGSSNDVVVIGAHMDSKHPSPGANDNASGVAVMLELARCLADSDGLVPTVRFVGFGAEEVVGASPMDHHFGSRHYVKSLSSSRFAEIESMISVDMVGYGGTFNVRSLSRGPMTTVRSLQAWGAFTGQPLPFLKDFGRDGWSDHEAFEQRGTSVAWLEWRNDPLYHTKRDTYSHVSASRVNRSGRLVRGWLLDLPASKLAALTP